MHIASHVLMVRPAHFGFNIETREDNALQHSEELENTEEIRIKAIEEFDQALKTLEAVGIRVTCWEDSPSPPKYDAVFANNWISFQESDEIILYPLRSPNRRKERNPELVDYFLARNTQAQVVDISDYETLEVYLEGTGSVVFDRPNRIAYATESVRTHPAFFERFCRYFRWKPVLFHTQNRRNLPVYHTNLMLSLGENFAVICPEVVVEAERSALLDKLEAGGRKLVSCTEEQMNQFCCNLLELKNSVGKSFIVLSERAYKAFSPSQLGQLETFGEPLVVSIPTIERVGGGGIRCMLTEIFGTYQDKETT